MECNHICEKCHKIRTDLPECPNYKLFKAIYGENAKMPENDKNYIDNK